MLKIVLLYLYRIQINETIAARSIILNPLIRIQTKQTNDNIALSLFLNSINLLNPRNIPKDINDWAVICIKRCGVALKEIHSPAEAKNIILGKFLQTQK